MAQRTLAAVLDYLRTGCAALELEQLADGELLGRFLADRDETAFAVLVHRHGPLVLGVCRRVLGDGHLVEDAFQATFLVLVRRATAIRREAPLGPWLYGVARRVALKARARAAAHQSRQRELADMPRTEPLDDRTWQELRPILDDEIGRLPEKCRVPLVLCYFEGKSYDEAARELGWPKSSLASRLARGRDLLRQRLVRRGITLSAGALTTALAEKSTGTAVAALLTINTAKAAAGVAAGKAVAENVLPAGALTLAEDVLRAPLVIKRKLVLVLWALSLAVGVGLAGYAAWVGQPPPEANLAIKAPPRASALDLHGDPLPPGAVARLGQDRWLHDIQARFAAFLPDGKTVVTVNVDRTIRVWEFPSGKEIRRITLPTLDISAAQPFGARNAALTEDGKTIATWLPEAASAIYLHDLATGKQLQALTVSAAVSGLTFSPNGKHLASMTMDRTARIWDWAKAKEVHHFVVGKPVDTKRSAAVFDQPGIHYAPDGKSLATGQDQEVNLWDPATGAKLRTIRGESMTKIRTLAFSPDGKKLALCSNESIVLVEAGTGKEIGKLTAPPGVQPGVAFGKDGTKLYASSYGGLVTEWDVAKGTLLRECKPPTNGGAISLSPDGNTLVGTSYGPPFLDLSGKDITALPSRTAPLVSLQFTPDGTHLLTLSWGYLTGRDQAVRKWDAVTGQDRGKINLPGISALIAISPNGKVLAAVPSEAISVGDGKKPEVVKAPKVVLIDAASGKELGQVTTGIPTSMRFSPDGKMLAIGQYIDKPRALNFEAFSQPRFRETKIDLYDVPGAELRQTLQIGKWEVQVGKQHDEGWRTLIFSPDGKTLAARADPRTLGLWDTTTGKRIGSVPLPQGSKLVYHPHEHQSMESAAFSPDGCYLVLDRDDGTAVLYELASGQPYRTFGKIQAPPKKVGSAWNNYLLPDEVKAGSCFAFSPDGRLLVRAGFDHLVRLWDTQTGRELAAFRGHAEAVTAVAFAPDGKTVASASKDGTALIWDVTRVRRPAAPAQVLPR